MNKNILIIGASSAIAEAVTNQYATDSAKLFLVGRNQEKLSSIAKNIACKGTTNVATHLLDVIDIASHKTMLEQAKQHLETIDVVLFAHGTLPDQNQCEQSSQAMLLALQTNTTSTLALLTETANSLARQQSGTIAVITSVAGDRGRPSNYVYGAAKAAISTFLEGLRSRLHKSGVNVLDIRPGFVDTPMTSGLNLPAPLVTQPDVIAALIVKAIEKRKSVIYTPFYWRYIMLLIKLIPGFLFKRLSL